MFNRRYARLKPTVPICTVGYTVAKTNCSKPEPDPRRKLEDCSYCSRYDVFAFVTFSAYRHDADTHSGRMYGFQSIQYSIATTRHATNQSSDKTIMVLIKQNNTTTLSLFSTVVLIVLTVIQNITMPRTDAFELQPATAKSRVKHPLTYCEAGRVSGKLNEDLCDASLF
jgi:hypothetical protein